MPDLELAHETIYQHPAKYKDVLLYITSWRRIDGGRDIRRDFPHSPRTLIHDLGQGSDSYVLTGFVSTRPSSDLDYPTLRGQLLAALRDRQTPGVLIHPVEGRLENMVARPGWSFSEAVDEDGVGRFVATFERSDVETAPTAVVGASVAAIDAARDATSSAVEATLAEMNISPGFVGNVSAAIEKVGAIKEGIEDAVGSLTIAVDQLNEWQATVTQFGDDIASLVAAPQDLALAAVGLFDSMTGLYAGVAGAARGTWDMFSSLFSFGDEDAEIVPTTSGLAERLATQSTLNSGVQVMALAHAYAAAMAMDFDTVPEITEVQSAMEAQYQKVYLSGLLDTDVLAQLTTLRRLLQEYLDARKLTASQLVTITTPATSARLLAFKWYGDTERGAEIAALNGVEDPAFVEGAVEIFTVWRP